MGWMFRGLHEHTIDAKGRVSLPQRFRDGLEGSSNDAGTTLIITTGIDRCLVAYPKAEWDAFEARLSALPQFDPAVVQIKRIYVAGATECTIDRNGRLLIPPMLREYAGLTRDAVFAGMVTTIEIWSKEEWTEQSRMSRSDRQAVATKLAELGL
ncbi:MAG: division/cell wall cluster transcriptional repressor MraZ, partial [Clostridia bacterium]|nr:division/cell wall cluster transcriptional repressor MraZ [Deltaproteobacteria bacterium]